VELTPESFQGCSQIKTLHLNGNPIKSFSGTTFMHMKRLGKIIMTRQNESCWSSEGKSDLYKFPSIIVKKTT